MREGVEDVVFCFLRFPSGLAAHLHLSWLDPHKERRFTVVGEQRMATFDDMALEGKITVYDKGFDQHAGLLRRVHHPLGRHLEPAAVRTRSRCGPSARTSSTRSATAPRRSPTASPGCASCACSRRCSGRWTRAGARASRSRAEPVIRAASRLLAWPRWPSSSPDRASAHTRTGEYQTMGTLPRDWASPYPLPGGVPMVDYGTFHARNPVTSAQYGLAIWSLWKRYGDRPRLRAALRVADWLVTRQQPSGYGPTASTTRALGRRCRSPRHGARRSHRANASAFCDAPIAHRRRDLSAGRAARAAPLRREVADGGLSVRRRRGL